METDFQPFFPPKKYPPTHNVPDRWGKGDSHHVLRDETGELIHDVSRKNARRLLLFPGLFSCFKISSKRHKEIVLVIFTHTQKNTEKFSEITTSQNLT